MTAAATDGPAIGEPVERVVGEDCRHCEDGTNVLDEHKGYRVASCDACGWIAVKEYGE